MVFQSWLDEALVINHINASEDINFDWGRLLEDLHRWSLIVDSTLFFAFVSVLAPTTGQQSVTSRSREFFIFLMVSESGSEKFGTKKVSELV